MVSKRLALALFTSLISLSLSGLPFGVVAASNQAACYAPLQVCGDGICDAYTGENKTSCPADCGTVSNPPPAGPTATPTSTLTPTATRFTSTPSPTASPTASATVTTTLVVVDLPTQASTPTLVPLTGVEGTGCGFMPYDQQSVVWQKAYVAMTRPKMIPLREDQQEVFVCNIPPDGKVCIPVYDGLLKTVNNDVKNVNLVQCDDSGKCTELKSTPTVSADLICYTVTQSDNITCATGCALAPDTLGWISLPLIGAISIETLTPALCIGALMLAAFVAFLIIVSRRRQKPEGAGD